MAPAAEVPHPDLSMRTQPQRPDPEKHGGNRDGSVHVTVILPSCVKVKSEQETVGLQKVLPQREREPQGTQKGPDAYQKLTCAGYLWREKSTNRREGYLICNQIWG